MGFLENHTPSEYLVWFDLQVYQLPIELVVWLVCKIHHNLNAIGNVNYSLENIIVQSKEWFWYLNCNLALLSNVVVGLNHTMVQEDL